MQKKFIINMKCKKRLDKKGITIYTNMRLERWLSWSKAHDWKSCNG